MNTQKLFGKISRAFIDRIGKSWCVYARSDKLRKVVNTHMFDQKHEAILTMREINHAKN